MKNFDFLFEEIETKIKNILQDATNEQFSLPQLAQQYFESLVNDSLYTQCLTIFNDVLVAYFSTKDKYKQDAKQYLLNCFNELPVVLTKTTCAKDQQNRINTIAEFDQVLDAININQLSFDGNKVFSERLLAIINTPRDDLSKAEKLIIYALRLKIEGLLKGNIEPLAEAITKLSNNYELLESISRTITNFMATWMAKLDLDLVEIFQMAKDKIVLSPKPLSKGINNISTRIVTRALRSINNSTNYGIVTNLIINTMQQLQILNCLQDLTSKYHDNALQNNIIMMINLLSAAETPLDEPNFCNKYLKVLVILKTPVTDPNQLQTEISALERSRCHWTWRLFAPCVCNDDNTQDIINQLKAMQKILVTSSNSEREVISPKF